MTIRNDSKPFVPSERLKESVDTLRNHGLLSPAQADVLKSSTLSPADELLAEQAMLNFEAFGAGYGGVAGSDVGSTKGVLRTAARAIEDEIRNALRSEQVTVGKEAMPAPGPATADLMTKGEQARAVDDLKLGRAPRQR